MLVVICGRHLTQLTGINQILQIHKCDGLLDLVPPPRGWQCVQTMNHVVKVIQGMKLKDNDMKISYIEV